jgi:hypothetical protein
MRLEPVCVKIEKIVLLTRLKLMKVAKYILITQNSLIDTNN